MLYHKASVINLPTSFAHNGHVTDHQFEKYGIR